MTVEDAGAPPAADGEFWLFGYGSLIWKPPPHFDRRIPGWVNGYVRRFWQASQDHRGTPEAPGRVVTLIEQSFWATLDDPHPAPKDGKVWGVAYRIKPTHVAEVKEYLDIREVNGYSIHYTPFHPAPEPATTTTSSPQPAPDPIRTLVYIGTPENPQFTGPQPVAALATHIHRSTGPSGPNRDYLLSLDEALRVLLLANSDGEEDAHIADLSRKVQALIVREEDEEDDRGKESGVVEEEATAVKRVVEHGRVGHGVSERVDEEEETEKSAP